MLPWSDPGIANALNETASHADMDQFALTQTSEDCAEGVQSFIEKKSCFHRSIDGIGISR